MTSWFGVIYVRCGLLAQWYCFGSAFSGAGSISNVWEHGIHCWLGRKSGPVFLYVTRRFSEEFLAVVIQFSYHHHHHHHVVLVARISLSLSRHLSLSFVASGRSSGQHPVSSHSCWMYVRAGRLAFARPCVGVHKSTSLMSSSLLLQQCPACLVRLTWIVFVIGGRWP